LNKAVQEGRFRKDLYYRIAIIIIKAEALRTHPEDIEALAEFYYKKYCEEMGKHWEPLPQLIIDQLKQYDFPGNVRELKNIIERYCILGNLSLPSFSGDLHSNARNQDNITVKQQNCDDLSSYSGEKLPTLNLEELEYKAIQAALKRTKGIHTNAAELLGISRQALERRLSRYKHS